MAYTERNMVVNQVLTAVSANYYTVPASVVNAVVKQVTLCNTDTVPRTVTMYLLPTSGTAPAAAYTMFSAMTLQPNETKIFGLSQVLGIGYTIAALASAANVVTINISGVERS